MYSLEKIKKSLNKDKKTLMFYLIYWDFYGVGRVISILITGLVKKYNIILVSSNTEGFPLPSSIHHIKINISDENKIINKLLFIASELNVDLFVGNTNLSDYMLKSYKEFRSNNIKTIAYNHENYFRTFEIFFASPIQIYRNQELGNANAVIWLTNYFNTIYSEEYSNGIVMPNPLVFPVKNNRHILTNNIIAIGDFTYDYKRIDLIIEVFAKILRRKSDVELYIVGNYKKDELDLLLKKFEIPCTNIHLVGQVKDVSKYYEEASVLLMTSETEGWGMILTEAGSFGIPTVMLNIDGLEDIITNGQNGFILDRDDLDGMADRVIELILNKDLYENISENCLNLSKRFEKEKIIERWERLIELVLNIDDQEELNKNLKKEFPTNVNKDITINRLVTTYERYFNDAVLYYHKAVKYRDKVIKDFDEAIKYRDNVIKDLDEAVKYRDNVIKDLDEAVKYRDKFETAGQNNIQDLTIKQLQNSWSYRIGRIFTYPLSIFLEFFKFISYYNLIKKSNLFDIGYYLANNEDVRKAKVDPIKHYLKFGWKEGRNPSTKFDGNEYLNKRPDVRVIGICPLVHYLKFGRDGNE